MAMSHARDAFRKKSAFAIFRNLWKLGITEMCIELLDPQLKDITKRTI